jgi:hypothetical protein
MTKLSAAQCEAAMARGEFGPDVAEAARSVAVVLTQSWCPQWRWMRAYLERLAASGREGPDLALFWVEYDLEPFFEPFMAYKEGVLGNDQVPYVRYYREGKLARESNFVDEGAFLRLAGAP